MLEIGEKKMATIKVCDRCGKICKEIYVLQMYKVSDLVGEVVQYKELCLDCREKLLNWLELTKVEHE